MKVVFRAFACILLIALLTGCSLPAPDPGNRRLAYLTPPAHFCGTLDYAGELYHAAIDMTESGNFSLMLSGEGPLAGFGFLHNADGWRISCGNDEYLCPISNDSLAGTYLTFVSLTEDCLISSEKSNNGETAVYSKNGTDFTLTFDSTGTLVRTETENSVFKHETFNVREE